MLKSCYLSLLTLRAWLSRQVSRLQALWSCLALPIARCLVLNAPMKTTPRKRRRAVVSWDQLPSYIALYPCVFHRVCILAAVFLMFFFFGFVSIVDIRLRFKFPMFLIEETDHFCARREALLVRLPQHPWAHALAAEVLSPWCIKALAQRLQTDNHDNKSKSNCFSI